MAARAWRSRRARTVVGAAILAVTGVPSAAAPSPSATPYDVSLFRWSVGEDAEGFDQGLLHDLVVGADGRVLLLGGSRAGETLTAAVWGSDDGRTWTPLEGDLPTDSVAFDGVETGDGFLITTLGDGVGRSYRSDGTSIEAMDGPGSFLVAVERSPAGLHLLDVAAAPTVWTSIDEGTTWTSAEVTSDDVLTRDLVTTADGTLVVLGMTRSDELETPTAWSSSDSGATWTVAALPLEPGTWTVADAARTPIGLLARFIDGTSSDMNGVNLLSPDGMAWETTVETTGWGSIGTAGPEAIIFGTDAAWHSPDGVTWTEEWWPTLAGFDVVASRPMPGGPVVAAGIRTTPPATGATFVGAPAPQAVPSAPIDLTSPGP